MRIGLLILMLLLVGADCCSAGEVSELAMKAQRAWRAGDGNTIIAIAHPCLLERIARLQVKWLEQEVKGPAKAPWIQFPKSAPTLEKFRALSTADQARSYFASMREVLRDHANWTFNFAAEEERVTEHSATVTVVERQHGPNGQVREVRYPFVFERDEKRWAYVSGGRERLHVDTQLMFLEP